MTECPECGTSLAGIDAKFCPECGARIAVAGTAGETRKIVTVVFCDVVGSTALGERLDPEAQRAVIQRYFDEMRRVLEAHGGRVEKFIGDAVMAVFGVPVVHEDDALRAARAAHQMQSAVRTLSAQLAGEYGVELSARIGVNTGEVVVGDGERGTVATGDAVNTAARLEQAAGAGEVLVGHTTYQLLRGAVDAEPVAPIVAKGKTEPVPAWRLIGVPEGTGRVEYTAADVAFVGRQRQLRMLQDGFDRAVEERICDLVTVVGVPGTGKTRLVHEFLARLDDRATVLRGRCLSYGDGIAFWPLLEMLRQAGALSGAESEETGRERLRALVASDRDAGKLVERLAPLAGLSGRAAGADETHAAVRRLFEILAANQPLVVVVDDLQWAEPAMLDLLEAVVTFLRDAPVLVVCLVRPEFLETRAAWGAGALNASMVQLSPLADGDVAQLIGELLGGAPVDPDVTDVVGTTCGGNALFVAQLVAMLREDGRLALVDGVWTLAGEVTADLPPSINALLRARLDRLPAEQRTVLEAASIMGTEFYVGALTALTDRTAPTTQLVELLRRDLIRPSSSDIADEDGYRFVHVLVREAAYAALPKATRARMHEQFAHWLETRSEHSTSDADEFIGYHLEQAFHLSRELGPADARVEGVGTAAARRLNAAAHRIYFVDPRSAASLLARAAALVTDVAEHCRLLHDRARASYASGDLAESLAAHDEALALAIEAGDERLELTARLNRAYVADQFGEFVDLDELLAMAERAERDYGGGAFPDTLLAAAFTRVHVGNERMLWADCAAHAARAVDLAETIGDVPRADQCRHFVAMGVTHGPTHVDEAIATVHQVLDTSGAAGRTHAVYWGMIALLHAYAGRRDEAMDALSVGAELLAGAEDSLWGIIFLWLRGDTEYTLGDLDAAEVHSRRQVEWLERQGESAWLSTYAPEHAIRFFDRVDDAEARRLLDLGRTRLVPDDVMTHALVRALDGMLHSREGGHEEAARLLAESIDWVRRGDNIVSEGALRCEQAEVLVAAGDIAGAAQTLRVAVELFERKGDVVDAVRARERLGQLTAATVR